MNVFTGSLLSVAGVVLLGYGIAMLMDYRRVATSYWESVFNWNERYNPLWRATREQSMRRMPVYRLLPVDAFILATCNSYVDEPESRHALSAPARRRCTILTMPNYLLVQYQEAGVEAIGRMAFQQIALERKTVEDRINSGTGATFDKARLSALRTVDSFESFSASARERFVRLVKALLDDATMAQIFTMGLLRDIALDLALVQRSEAAELASLGAAVSDKVLHQLRGSRAIADQVKAVSEGLPNQAEVSRLLDRMLAGSADELLPLV